MKKYKYKIFIIALFSLFFVVGCGNNNTKVLTCSGVVAGSNVNSAATYKYTFNADKLSRADIEIVFKDFTVNNLSSVWDTYKNQFTEQNSPVEDLGFKRTVKADDKKYTFSVFMEIDYEKISKETMQKYGIEDYSLKTYEEIKKQTTSDGNFSCE